MHLGITESFSKKLTDSGDTTNYAVTLGPANKNERSKNMYRITINGKPYGHSLDQICAEALANRLTRCINGIGMMKVRS